MTTIASAITPATSLVPAAANQAAASGAGTPSAPSPQDALTSKQTFLQLLVAQIKNQNPLNPTDPTQFVGQLTSYSQLEQLININTGVQALNTALSPPSSPSSGSSGTPGASGGTVPAKPIAAPITPFEKPSLKL